MFSYFIGDSFDWVITVFAEFRTEADYAEVWRSKREFVHNLNIIVKLPSNNLNEHKCDNDTNE